MSGQVKASNSQNAQIVASNTTGQTIAGVAWNIVSPDVSVVVPSSGDLIVDGVTISAPAVLYLTPDGLISDQPNGQPLANFI
jgi:hypothetical protein